MQSSLNFVPNAGLKPANGYGKLEIALWSALADLGCHINPVGHIREDGASLLAESAQRQFDLPLARRSSASLVIGRPSLGDTWHLRNTRRYLYTMSESTRVSDEWVADINRLYQGVIVPTPSLIEIYRASGVGVPVYCVPMGITLPPIIRRREFTRQEMVFLTYSLGEMRKGAELAILAFQRLFRGDLRYRLKVKTVTDPAIWLPAAVDDQISLVANSDLSEEAWHELLADADCFVFPSRGEGFGLPPREATLAGTPTIATQWLGLHDVDCWGLPVRVMEMRPAPFTGEANHPDAQWAEPDLSDLMFQMQYVAANPQRAHAKAHFGQHYLRSFTWQRMAIGILEVIEHAL